MGISLLNYQVVKGLMIKIRGRVQCVFSINQREIYKKTGESNIPFMSELAQFFQVNLNHKINKFF